MKNISYLERERNEHFVRKKAGVLVGRLAVCSAAVAFAAVYYMCFQGMGAIFCLLLGWLPAGLTAFLTARLVDLLFNLPARECVLLQLRINAWRRQRRMHG